MRYEKPMIELLRLLQGDLLMASDEGNEPEEPGDEGGTNTGSGSGNGNGRPLPPDMFG